MMLCLRGFPLLLHSGNEQPSSKTQTMISFNIVFALPGMFSLQMIRDVIVFS